MPFRLLARSRRAPTPAKLVYLGVAPALGALVLGFTLLGGSQSEGCLTDGSGILKVALSGTLEHSIEWGNDDMECGGFNGSVQFSGVPQGTSTQIDLSFDIDAEEGATGTGLPARAIIYDWDSGANFANSNASCTVDLTEQSLIDENPAFRSYRVVGSGSCAEPLGQLSGDGAGTGKIEIGSFEFVGLAVWQ